MGIITECLMKRGEFAYATINQVGLVRIIQRIDISLQRNQKLHGRVRERAKNRLAT